MLVGAHILRGDADAATAGSVAVTGAVILATGVCTGSTRLRVGRVWRGRLPLGPRAPARLALCPEGPCGARRLGGPAVRRQCGTHSCRSSWRVAAPTAAWWPITLSLLVARDHLICDNKGLADPLAQTPRSSIRRPT